MVCFSQFLCMNGVCEEGKHLIRASTADFDSLLSINRGLLQLIGYFYFDVEVSLELPDYAKDQTFRLVSSHCALC